MWQMNRIYCFWVIKRKPTGDGEINHSLPRLGLIHKKVPFGTWVAFWNKFWNKVSNSTRQNLIMNQKTKITKHRDKILSRKNQRQISRPKHNKRRFSLYFFISNINWFYFKNRQNLLSWHLFRTMQIYSQTKNRWLNIILTPEKLLVISLMKEILCKNILMEKIVTRKIWWKSWLNAENQRLSYVFSKTRFVPDSYIQNVLLNYRRFTLVIPSII